MIEFPHSYDLDRVTTEGVWIEYRVWSEFPLDAHKVFVSMKASLEQTPFNEKYELAELIVRKPVALLPGYTAPGRNYALRASARFVERRPVAA